MTLKQLEYFFKLSEDPHIINAAKLLGVSQPAISLSIKALETELREQLFSRVGKKLVLNERGRFFKEQTYRCYQTLMDAGNLFRSNKLAGSLFLAASKTFSTYLVPEILFNYRLKFPGVYLAKTSDNSAGIIKGIKSGKFDIGFVESNFKDSEIVKEKIGEDELILVSSDRDLAEGIHYIDSLFNRKWVLRETGSGTRDIFLDRLLDLGLELDIFLELTGFDEIKNILRTNKQAVSCISRLAVQNELDKNELFHVRLNNLIFSRDLFLVYRKNRFQTLLFKSFVSFVKEAFTTIPLE